MNRSSRRIARHAPLDHKLVLSAENNGIGKRPVRPRDWTAREANIPVRADRLGVHVRTFPSVGPPGREEDWICVAWGPESGNKWLAGEPSVAAMCRPRHRGGSQGGLAAGTGGVRVSVRGGKECPDMSPGADKRRDRSADRAVCAVQCGAGLLCSLQMPARPCVGTCLSARSCQP